MIHAMVHLCITHAIRTVNAPFCTNQTCWTHPFPVLGNNQITLYLQWNSFIFSRNRLTNQWTTNIWMTYIKQIYTAFIQVSGLKLWSLGYCTCAILLQGCAPQQNSTIGDVANSKRPLLVIPKVQLRLRVTHRSATVLARYPQKLAKIVCG